MRKKTMMRQLAALGYDPLRITPAMRAQVRLLQFNKVPHHRIAMALSITLLELKYYFSKELQLATDEIHTQATLNIMELATQRTDMGVALRANEMLGRNAAGLRPPPPQKPEDASTVTDVARMTLEEVRDALAKLDEAEAAGAGGTAPDGEE